ncbi:MAG: PAS domain S-box protein [Proteobacteria bacterium]|nr:PAS domain S-box protein [Pseudomonadota bacterium]
MEQNLNILNLEDSPNDSELIKEILFDAGIECDIIRVENEKDYLWAIENHNIDIILADYTLPLFDGLSALKIALKKCPDVPFVFVTGTLGEEIAVESLKSGATDYVLKDGLLRLVPAVQKALREVEFKIKRKQSENALRESEEKYRELVESISSILYTVDNKGIVTYISPSVQALIGYSSSEIIGRSLFVLIYPEDISYIEKQFKKRLSNSLEPSEYRIVKKSGETIWVTSSSREIIREKKLVGLRGLIVNIDEDKKFKEKLNESLDRLQNANRGIIQAMALTIETRDPYTAGHQRRVACLARAIATEMNLSEQQIEGLNMAGSIHDLGKLSVPADILSKPSRLSEIEYELIKIHPEAGYNILKDIEFPWPVAQIILQHHERMDGSGYPKGLMGEDIIMESRILSVADVVEAISSHRPYRSAQGVDKALEEVADKKGILYDPVVVDACLRVFKEKGFKF